MSEPNQSESSQRETFPHIRQSLLLLSAVLRAGASGQSDAGTLQWLRANGEVYSGMLRGIAEVMGGKPSHA